MNPPLSFTPSPYKSFGVRKKNYVKTKRSIQSWFNQSNHGTSDKQIFHQRKCSSIEGII